MIKLAKNSMLLVIIVLLFVVVGLTIYKSKFSDRHAATAAHTKPQASGQGAFESLSEVSRILDLENADWTKVDMDALWAHLKNMNWLMLHSSVEKQALPNGVIMNVSGDAKAISAMNEMIPAHSNFLTTVRPAWAISFQKTEKGYSIRVTSEQKSQVEKIQALGFSGFMVQDDHHASHHLRIASGDQVHTATH